MRQALICSSHLQANYYNLEISFDDNEYSFDDQSNVGNSAMIVSFHTGLLEPWQGYGNLWHLGGSYSCLICSSPTLVFMSVSEDI